MASARERLIGQRPPQREYPSEEPWVVGADGELLDLVLDAKFDLDEIRRGPPGLWRYRGALPRVPDASVVSFGEGMTPLVPIRVGGAALFAKLDYLFTTGSYKDRGASVLVSKAHALGVRALVEDSSGNAGASIAAYAARAGLACTIYAPSHTSPAKLAQVRLYGAELKLVDGTREETAARAQEAARTRYYASHAQNPYFVHGTKTVAFELWEQLDLHAPEVVVVPVGNGTLLLGVYLGFSELVRAGLIERIPAIVAVQHENVAPLANAYHHRVPDTATTRSPALLAEGIAIAAPVRAAQILEAVAASGGSFVTVNDDELLAALFELGAQGLCLEPTALAGPAGAAKYLRQASHGPRVVTICTGHGLKASARIEQLLRARAGA